MNWLILFLLAALSVLLIAWGWQRETQRRLLCEQQTGDELPRNNPVARARELAFKPTFFTEREQNEVRELLEYFANTLDRQCGEDKGTP